MLKSFILTIPQNCMCCNYRDAEYGNCCELMIDNPAKSLEEQYELCVIRKICKNAIPADAIEELEGRLHIMKKTAEWLGEKVPRWISVSERLPEDKAEMYWCFTDMGIMCECRWTNNRYGIGASDRWGWNVMDVPQYQKITHWMPLPAPPKEEEW